MRPGWDVKNVVYEGPHRVTEVRVTVLRDEDGLVYVRVDAVSDAVDSAGRRVRDVRAIRFTADRAEVVVEGRRLSLERGPGGGDR